MTSPRHLVSLSDLTFIEHALRTRVAMLTPRHQELLERSKTLARLRRDLDASKAAGGAARRTALQALLVAIEARVNKLEGREGRISMPYLGRALFERWSVDTQISSVPG